MYTTTSTTKNVLTTSVFVGLLFSSVMNVSVCQASSSPTESSYFSGKTLGVGVVGLCVAAVFIVTQHSYNKQVKKMRAAHDEMHDLLTVLAARIDALPFNDFTRQADKKIAEVRRYLEEDANGHRRMVLRDIDALRSETIRLAQELERRQSHLDGVVNLVASVRDHDNVAFVEALVEAKNEVDRSFALLRNDRATLHQEMLHVADQIQALNNKIHEQEEHVGSAQHQLTGVQERVVGVQDQATAVHNFIADTVEEIAVARKNVARVQNEFAHLNNEIKVVLRKMEDVAQSAKNEKDAAEAQLQQVRDALQEVQSRVVALAATINQEESQLREVDSALVGVKELINRAHTQAHQLSNSPQLPRTDATQTPQVSRHVESVVSQALSVLSNVFGIALGSDVAAYRSAYRKFSLKNHPEKGGAVAAYQAVDGLYKIIIDNNLFGAQSVTPALQKEIAVKVQEVEANKKLIIK